MNDFRKYRESLNMTSTEFAHEMGLSRQTLGPIERGVTPLKEVYRNAALYVVSRAHGVVVTDKDVDAKTTRRRPSLKSKVSKIRKLARVSQTTFALLTGMSKRAIEDIEQGIIAERPIHVKAALYGASVHLGRIVTEDELT